MLIKCEHCGTYMDDGDKFCPMCGAPNPEQPQEESPLTLDPNAEEEQLHQATEEVLHRADQALGVPQTMEELRRFADRHNLPLSQMHMHLGEDYRGPKAYGIYRDESGQFVVYKNKADGQRAVRYQGPDEARAVRELYEKMREQLAKQKQSRQSGGATGAGGNVPLSQQPYRQPMASPPPYPVQNRGLQKKKGLSAGGIVAIVVAMIVAMNVGVRVVHRLAQRLLWPRSGITPVYAQQEPRRGYYRYNGDAYYRDDDSWYLYDPARDLWYGTILEEDDYFADHYDDYYESYRYEDGADYADFYGGTYDYEQDADRDSGGYGNYSYSDDDHNDWSWDWDDDNDWDWDDDYDWDDGWDDWDSDW